MVERQKILRQKTEDWRIARSVGQGLEMLAESVHDYPPAFAFAFRVIGKLEEIPTGTGAVEKETQDGLAG
jgi:hypothetical protein